MRILFLDSEDDPQSGPWSAMVWDQVIDLGIAGPRTRANWESYFKCQVTDLGFARTPSGQVRDALAAGLGRLLDEHGIDWWEVLGIQYVRQIFRIIALQKFAASISGRDEVFVSRGGFDFLVLQKLLGRRISCFSRGAQIPQKFRRFYRRSCRLSYSQIKQISWDKYDSQHRLRALLSPRRARCRTPIILLPTAYLNVTRMALSYAETLLDSKFLLVAGRSSGWAKTLPVNVDQSDLSSYLSPKFDCAEHSGLLARWNELRIQFRSHPVLHALLQSGIADSFGHALKKWMIVRDAWINVFETEPVDGVLSCDDVNPYTHIPGLLAKRKGIPWTSSHHGAFDGHHLVRESRADIVLAKGNMERDYLVKNCGISKDRVAVGAPNRPAPDQTRHEKSSIVFFSEDYEVSGARVGDFYRDVLPSLVRLAEQNAKLLVLKLHPAESLRDRRRILNEVLSREEQCRVRIVEGPITEQMMSDIWFACTVISTTALDCAIMGIPVFLCGWLENWPFGYMNQFVAFRVGVKLSSPEEITQIPRLLEQFEPCNPRNIWQPICPDALSEILSKRTATFVQVA